MRHWLFKSEPDSFSIDDLAQQPGGRDHWDGIRNYQARNYMRDDMHSGDLGFFYHSSCAEPGIVGTVEVVSEAYVDHTALDPESPYFDPKATVENPRWVMVDLRFRSRYLRTLRLSQLRGYPELAHMPLLRKGNRLSIQPVSPSEWQYIESLTRAR